MRALQIATNQLQPIPKPVNRLEHGQMSGKRRGLTLEPSVFVAKLTPSETRGALCRIRLREKSLRCSNQVPKVRGLIVIHGDSIIPMGQSRDSQIQRKFGDRVREIRKQKGLSQESLALACDLDRSYIGGVERGERNISLINIYKIAEALGVKAKELFDA